MATLFAYQMDHVIPRHQRDAICANRERWRATKSRDGFRCDGGRTDTECFPSENPQGGQRNQSSGTGKTSGRPDGNRRGALSYKDEFGYDFGNAWRGSTKQGRS